MKVTIKDIAKATGLSTSTISRSLNDSHLISDRTKKKVKKVALEMGFHFNENARALSSNRTNRIKLFVSKGFTHFESEHFFRKLNETLITELEKYGMEIIITPSHSKLTGESNLYKGINSSSVDGLIIAHADLTKEEYNYIKASKIPVLFLYYTYPFLKDEDNFVGSDNYRGAIQAVKYLVEKGATRLMTLGIGDKAYEFAERNRGYRKGIKKYKAEDLGVYQSHINYKDSYEFVMENKEKIKECNGLFLQSDHYFFGVKRGLEELGIDIGKDIEIIGYDNMELTRYFYGGYSSIDQNLDKLVTRGVEHLVKVIRDEEESVIKYNVRPRVVKGGSYEKI